MVVIQQRMRPPRSLLAQAAHPAAPMVVLAEMARLEEMAAPQQRPQPPQPPGAEPPPTATHRVVRALLLLVLGWVGAVVLQVQLQERQPRATIRRPHRRLLSAGEPDNHE